MTPPDRALPPRRVLITFTHKITLSNLMEGGGREPASKVELRSIPGTEHTRRPARNGAPILVWGRRGAGEPTGRRNAYLTTATYKERVTSYRICMERGQVGEAEATRGHRLHEGGRLLRGGCWRGP
jgi:hypothetical protein